MPVQEPGTQPTTPPPIHLPAEIILRILDFATLPPALCPTHLFEKCLDPWSCPYGTKGHIQTLVGAWNYPSHSTPQKSPALTPSRSLTSVSHLFCHEAHKIFYTHNLFISSFSYTPRRSRTPYLFDFIDEPGWWDVAFCYATYCVKKPHVEKYRHLIRHLVLTADSRRMDSHWESWDWPLKVDWKTLPNLETLYLDFRTISSARPDFESMAGGAMRMEGMKLKKLVLVGLCSHEFYGNADHEDVVRRIFGVATIDGGTLDSLELWDVHPAFLD